MDLTTLKTPSLVLDLERVKRNAARMTERVKKFGTDLRPHIKTHKCLEVARIQTSGHSGAVTVSTLAEARAFAQGGFKKITYAIPIEPGKFSEAIEISRSCEQLSLITDDEDIPSALNEAARKADVQLNVFLKVDSGYHRCGVEPADPLAIEIPKRITSSSNLTFGGILTHAGHSYNSRNKEEVLKLARHERDLMAEFAEQLRTIIDKVPIVSIGSTPTITSVDHLNGVDEVRPGNYIFFDAFQATLGTCNFDDCALTVLASVTHRDFTRRKIVVDAGAIALSKDRGAVELDANCGYGRVLDLEGRDLGMTIESMSQEHGVFQLDHATNMEQVKVGTRVRVLANHSCLTAAQHSYYHVVENGQVVDEWKIHTGW
jgi:D-serine deaminase-like pyridoxal phosphate-dependent protein